MAGSVRILVCDDQEIIRMGCSKILEEKGYEVEMAENGRIGLEKIKNNHFDLLLLDLHMPEMGGMELLDHIEQVAPDLTTIIISANTSIEVAVDAVKKGAYDYIPKPFTPDEFRAKVDRALEKNRLLREAKKLREERDRNLLEVANEKTRTATIINSIGEGLLATNRLGQLVLLNPIARKMLKIKDLDSPGKNIAGYLRNEQLETCILNVLSNTESRLPSKTIELDLGNEKYLEATISPIVEESGELLGAVTALRDISQVKKTEKLKTYFVSMVSHELKAPVAAIVGYLNLILEGLTLGNRDRELDVVRRSRDKAESLFALINDLLDLSRIQTGRIGQNVEPTDMNEVLKSTLELFENQANMKHIQMEVNIASDLKAVMGNKEEIARIFINLLSNAIKYTPENGRVSVIARQINSNLEITIQDTGIGISKTDQNRLFDEFFRAENALKRRISGTGLGLSIVKKIIDTYRGDIEVESEENKGSTFRVTLPTLNS